MFTPAVRLAAGAAFDCMPGGPRHRSAERVGWDQVVEAEARPTMEILLKTATIVVMTHGLRVLGRLLGPRWGGLVLGLPCSTAVVLVFLGRERGADFAVKAAESGVLGLVAAVTLALAHATAIRARWRLPAALGAAILAYLGVAWIVHQAAPDGALWRTLVSIAAILAAAGAARGLHVSDDAPWRLAPSRVRSLVLRTVVPIICLHSTTGLAGAIGHRWAGLLSTFPSTFLAVVVVTQMESGAAVTIRTIKAFPMANLSMVAFVAVFRLACPCLGLVQGTACGYLAALIVLLLVELASRWSGAPPRSTRAAADTPHGPAAVHGPRRPPARRGGGAMSARGLANSTARFQESRSLPRRGSFSGQGDSREPCIPRLVGVEPDDA